MNQSKNNMKSTYTPYIKSPFQIASKKRSVSVSETNPVIQEEIEKHLTSHSFTVTFKEDTQTLNTFKNVSGVVAFSCELRKGENIVGYGRGFSVINGTNRYIERTIRTAINSSFINAVVQSTKLLNGLGMAKSQSSTYELQQEKSPVLITEKQRNYLLELARKNVDDADELKQWEEQIDSLTREEASEHINAFLEKSDNNY